MQHQCRPGVAHAAACLVLILSGRTQAFDPTPIPIDDVPRTTAVSFEQELLPVLRQKCLACHSAGEKQDELVLESPQTILKGGDKGPVVIAGNSGDSRLLKLASHRQEPFMPPPGNDVAAADLTPRELGLFKLWIDQGARSSGSGSVLSPQAWRPLPRGINPVFAVAITDDGQYVACSRANQIFIYHVPTGQLMTRLTDPALPSAAGDVRPGMAHRDLVQSLAFNRDGDLLATGSFREVKLWRRPRDVRRLNLAAQGPVTALAVSPDRVLLATAGGEHAIRLWNLATGELRHTLSGHTDVITGLQFSCDGLTLYSSSKDRTLRAWNVGDGAALGQFETPVAIHAIAVVCGAAGQPADPPAAEWLVSGGAENVLRVWQVPHRAASSDGTAPEWVPTLAREIPGHSGPITSLAAVPGVPPQVVSGSEDNTVRRWNLENGQQTGQWNHGGQVLAVAVSPNGQRIAAASNNHTIRLWNVQNGSQLAEMRGDLRLKTHVARLNQQQNAANSRQNVARQALEAAEKDLPVKTEAEKKASEALAAANTALAEKRTALKTADEARVLVERTAIEAAAAAQQMLAAKAAADQHATEMALLAQRANERMNRLQSAAQSAPQDQKLAQSVGEAQREASAATARAQEAAAAQGPPARMAEEAARTANEAAGKVSEAQKPYADAVTAVRQAESAQNLAAQTQAVAARELAAATALVPRAKEALAQAEAAQKQAQQELEAANRQSAEAEQPIRCLAFSPDGRRLASGGDFPSIHTWDSDTGTAVAESVGHTGVIQALAFISDAEIASGSADQTAGVWEQEPGWILERTIGRVDDPLILIHRVMALDFSDDGQLLATGGGEPSRNGEVKVWNVADGHCVLALPEAHLDGVLGIALSPDGRRVASAGADKYVRLFDVATGQQLRRYEGHTNYVLGVAWKADGQTLASCSADNTIKIWEVETGDQRQTISNMGKAVTAVRFVGESDEIVSSCGDRIVRLNRAGDGGQFMTLGGTAAYLHCVDVTPNRQLVVAGSHDGMLHIWNGQNSQHLRELPPPE